jgi:hypothetical protein
MNDLKLSELMQKFIELKKKQSNLLETNKFTKDELKNVNNLFKTENNNVIIDLNIVIEKISLNDKNTNEKDETEEESPAAVTPKIFNLKPNNLSLVNFTDESRYRGENNSYKMDGNDIYLMGDLPLANMSTSIATWYLEFINYSSFGCCGFGIMSLDDPQIHSSFRGTGKHPLFCGCCNGSWGSGSVNHNITINNALQQDSQEYGTKFKFEYNFNDQTFNVFRPNGQPMGSPSFSMINYSYTNNLVFVVTSNGGPRFSFNLLPS